MTQADQAHQPAPMRRGVKLLLIASLALNLVFIGLTASAFWKHRDGHGWRVPKHIAFLHSVEKIAPELPEQKRAKAESIIEKMRSDVVPIARDYRQARKNAIEAMLSDDYDEKTLESALSKIREIRAGTETGMHMLALELFRDFTNEERRRFFEIYKTQRYRKGKWRKKRKEAEK